MTATQLPYASAMAASGTDVDTLCAELRGRQGARITPTLRDVLTVLASGHDHLTAGDVVEQLRSRGQRAQVSTVYRTLERLSAWGLVEHVHLGHGALAYHLLPEPHAHVVCEGCGAVVDVPGSVLRPLANRLQRDHAFTLRTGHVALSGWCESCLPAEGQQAAASSSNRRSSP
jgi:Fur family ferric uptake transcriptional regulator